MELNVEVLTTLIGSVGFPILMCLIFVKQLQDITKAHKNEMDSMTEAINNNTQVMNKILIKLGVEE